MSSADELSTVIWHALPTDLAVAALRTSVGTGLSADEAARRLHANGRNVLPESHAHSVGRLAARQLRGTLVLLLVVSAAVAVITGEFLDAAAIVLVLLINATLGFATEFQAHRALKALRDLDPRRAFVVRDAKPVELDARDVVVGDVILLEAGVVIPADARVIECTDLRADESLLTGESVPARKRESVVPANAVLADRHDLVYAGTTVVSGVGRAVVTNTGGTTELGRIGELVTTLQPPRPPIERRLEQLGRVLTLAVGGIIALLVTVGLARGAPILAMLETGVALAVAAVPEALPAVATVALAIGAVRMSRRNVIVRRLAAIESLGATNIVCVDKTGTLTSGRMTVTELAAPGWRSDLGLAAAASIDARTRQALRTAALASVASTGSAALATPVRESTDAAFVIAARDRGVLNALPTPVSILPFAHARMLSAAFACDGTGLRAFVKGAPHAVLARCTRFAHAHGDCPLDDAFRAEIGALHREMTARGLRVLAVADGPVPGPGVSDLRELTFHCLAALSDPIVPDAPSAIATLRDAGVRIVMLTGDHGRTAAAVGAELGLCDARATVLDAGEVEGLGPAAFGERIRAAAVIARVTPEDKLRVVETFQASGNVVGVFGDGVNDAPALRRADVGVAMGVRGSDVAKEAAEIVLRDDRLDSLRHAIFEGRVIFDNIRHAVVYLLACNVAELIFLLIASLAGTPLVFTPLQLLWLNLVTDTFPALALAREPGAPSIMRRGPNPRGEAIVGRRDWLSIAGFGASMSAASLLAWSVVASARGASMAATAAFGTLALAQLLHLGTVRSPGTTRASRDRLYGGRWAHGALVTGVMFVALAVSPPLVTILRLATPDASTVIVIVGASAVVTLVNRVAAISLARPPVPPPALRPA